MVRNKDKTQNTFPPHPLLPRLKFTTSSSTPLRRLPQAEQGDGEWGLQSVRNSSSLLLLPSQAAPCSNLGPSQGLRSFSIHLLQCGLSTACGAFREHPPAAARGPPGASGLHHGPFHGLQGNTCFTMVFSRGCRGVSAGEPAHYSPSILRSISKIQNYPKLISKIQDKQVTCTQVLNNFYSSYIRS